jgi:outer membrane protein, multidrug efflux system
MRRISSPRRTRPALRALPALLAGACAPAATLHHPPELRSAAWQATSEAGGEVPFGLGAAFRSPELAELTARALRANPDLGIAAARIRQARGELAGARAALLPTAGLSLDVGGATRGGGLGDLGRSAAGLDISYEIDLLGGRSAARRSAAARFAAAEWEREAAALLVEAEVARGYAQYAALAERIRLIGRNLDHARELDRIVNVRFRSGAATRLETGFQAIQIRQLEAERVRLSEGLAQARNALAVLLGEEAPLFRLQPPALSALAVPALAASQPADLLVRRPDLRAAEARIAAASGDVQRARAAFLPRLSVSARALGEAATLGGPVATVTAVTGQLLAPIFNRGALRGGLMSAEGVQYESVEAYRKSVLSALAETENALTAVELSAVRAALLDTIVAEARETARLARIQYMEGEADLQWVMDAEQQLVQAEDARALAALARLEAAIDLFRAMGGAPAR